MSVTALIESAKTTLLSKFGSSENVVDRRVDPAAASDPEFVSKIEPQDTTPVAPFNIKQKVLEILNSFPVFVLMITCTFLALFLFDICTYNSLPKDQDDSLGAAILTIFVIFCVEMILNIWVVQGYFPSFFCLIDFLSTISLITDIPQIWSNITSNNVDLSGNLSTQLVIVRTARVARAAAQIGRIIRVARLTRLFRLLKLWDTYEFANTLTQIRNLFEKCKSCDFAEPKSEQNEPLVATLKTPTSLTLDDDTEENKLHETVDSSRVGVRYSEITSYRMIFIVLLLVFVVPQLTVTSTSRSEQYGLDFVCSLTNDDVSPNFFNSSVDLYRHGAYSVGIPFDTTLNNFATSTVTMPLSSVPREVESYWFLLHLYVSGTNNSYRNSFVDLSNYRITDITAFQTRDACIAIFSDRTQVETLALYSICITCIVIFVLALGTVLFTREANVLVIVPVVRMLNVIYDIQKHSASLFQLLGVIHYTAKGNAPLSPTNSTDVDPVLNSTLATRRYSSMIDNTAFRRSISSIGRSSTFVRSNSMDSQHSSLSLVSRASTISLAPEKGSLDSPAPVPVDSMTLCYNDCNSFFQKLYRLFVSKIFEQDDSEIVSETYILEKTFEKISGLLQVLYGDSVLTTIGPWVDDVGNINIDTGVRERIAIIAHCNIRQYSNLVNVLGEKSSALLNAISELVHSIAVEYGGIVQVSDQTGFVLIWKLPEILDSNDFADLSTRYKSSYFSTCNYVDFEDVVLEKREAYQQFAYICDNAMAACVKIAARTLLEPLIQSVCQYSKIGDNFPGYDFFSIGVGVHIGTVSEGVVGTTQILNVSIVSPAVDVAHRLADLTSSYKVFLLISDELYLFINPFFKQRCRLVDSVHLIKLGWEEEYFKSSLANKHLVDNPLDLLLAVHQPHRIYCFDIFPGPVDIPDKAFDRIKSHSVSLKRKDYRRRRILNLTNASLSELIDGAVDFEDKEFYKLQSDLSIEFFEYYHLGVSYYFSLDWETAHYYLSLALNEDPNDVPAALLINYIEDHNKIPPALFTFANSRPLIIS